jgi:starch phosphorylase
MSDSLLIPGTDIGTAAPHGAIEQFTHVPRIAYFSMEIALRNDIATYAGGLGVLAGDLLRSAADLDVGLVAITLVSRRGYFRQQLTPAGDQIELPDEWDPSRFATRLGTTVLVRLGSEDVWVGAWLYVIESPIGGRTPVLLLDTNDERNGAATRTLTDRLYIDGNEFRFRQEAILGIGGVRMLRALGFKIREFHMNEGHSALLSLELLREEIQQGATADAALQTVRSRNNFTTHTPVEAAYDRFSWDLVYQFLGETLIDRKLLRRLGGEKELNVTRLALETSGLINGVAPAHAKVEKKLFPEFAFKSVSNGVHSPTWTCASIAALFDRYIPEWRCEPEYLNRAVRIPDDELRDAHRVAKQALIDFVRERTGFALQADKPVLAFARRMTGYKRPDLLFHDDAALRAIAAEHPFQVVLAGKAHPNDEQGKQMIRLIHQHARELAPAIPIVFVPGYDLDVARVLVAGSDLWLNTPLPPLEASGTSGMKAAHNGVPSLSVLDGWWVDGWIEGVTGWAIEGSGTAEDAHSLYTKLRDVILPLYNGDGDGWTRVMKGCIVHNASLFNSHRMLRRYAAEVYLGAE